MLSLFIGLDSLAQTAIIRYKSTPILHQLSSHNLISIEMIANAKIFVIR